MTKWLAAIALGMLLASGPAVAQSLEQRVIRQLEAQGYERITVGRTLLGRVRFRAQGPEGRREIVIDPRTGVILRDNLYIRRNGGAEGGGLLGLGPGGNRGQGEYDDDDGGYDDDDNGGDDGDDGDDDNGGGDDDDDGDDD